VPGCCECDDDPLGFGAMELVIIDTLSVNYF
jgi:hypothetical protein